jgi:peptidoglycan/xylan/chitin deacetylase (PgdA/CDA1 family)
MSLDCEGKWGMADCLRPYHHRDLTSAKLAEGYWQLLSMLAEYDIPATFAFVMAFALSERELSGFPILDRFRQRQDPWLESYWQCLEGGFSEGWHEPACFEMVRAAGVHEIASHSFCHRPLGDSSIDGQGAAVELDLATAAARLKGVELKTLVFPRNEVGNLSAVRRAGYLGYRTRLKRHGGNIGRIEALLEEFAMNRGPQEPLAMTDGLVAIPSGRFFNWRFGLRLLVPPAVTRKRFRNQLEQCAHEGGVVHLWLHPHNFATGPGTAPVLAAVLSDVARLRDRGRSPGRW